MLNLIEPEIDSEPVLNTIVNQQIKASLERLINHLPINYRAIFILRAIEKCH